MAREILLSLLGILAVGAEGTYTFQPFLVAARLTASVATVIRVVKD